MFKLFCFSLDRENFSGEFATREEAKAAGMAAAARSNTPVDAVYVAKREPINPQADGHADRVVADMIERMRIKYRDEGFLEDVTEQQLADLDASIEHAILEWLARHRLGPAPRMVALSEYPVINPREHPATRVDEVALIGMDVES